MLYFIVRVDVKQDDGLQRVFGCFDDIETAERELVNIKSVRAGTFEIYRGRKAD